jgi:hypothetical protein
MPCGYDVGEERHLERSERLRFPADEARRVVAVALALERHLRIDEIDLAALERAEAGFTDARQQREREDFVKVLAEMFDEDSLLGLADFAPARLLLGDAEFEVRRQEGRMVVTDMVERGPQCLHCAVDCRVRDQLFQRAPLFVLAGGARRRHDAPLIADLGDVCLIKVVKECLGTENVFDPSEFARRRLFPRLAADDLRAIEFGGASERHRLPAACDLGVDLLDCDFALLLRYLERASAASVAHARPVVHLGRSAGRHGFSGRKRSKLGFSVRISRPAAFSTPPADEVCESTRTRA